MRDFDESNITTAVLDRFDGTPDPRLKAVMQGLVRHLHAFVREVEPSFGEWRQAIEYLTRTGQMCSDVRQEFILLSDTLGVSMLVDAINHRQPAGATQTTVLGPFYVQDAPEVANGSDIAGGAEGEPLLVEGTVSAAGGGPLAGALVEVWHSDADGYYDVQKPEPDAHALRARLRTDAEGRFRFWSIMPRFYPIPDDGPVGEMLAATNRHPNRPAHVHFMISFPGYDTLVTHVFAADSPYLDSDAVFGVKTSLISHFARETPGTAPDGREMDRPWRRLNYDFGLKKTAVGTGARRVA
ncbi:intradiol ring-cleavage dioxygenase [Roseomonas sp. NAR14]|uniref:Intradiol ring-cleavage dioxygenase n=1 Tax=Roseomonas acroporae TaxID=2937791 RepID=A0A9X1YCR5_9PROT|nr:intradiol ring-cleavage dioxygenase [Roseomonas acroporae]MCK8787360.1 intradiol ring-cleavage dioxygenase [Roseomonas acroporae]